MATAPTPQEPPSARELTRKLDGEWHNHYGTALCPAHDDVNHPSLAISEKGGKTLVHCHKGCEQTAVLDALRAKGAWPQKAARRAESFEAVYSYHDADGELRLQVVRKPGKKFIQRQPDGNGGWAWNAKGAPPLIYRLPEVMEAIALERPVFVVEGEKDADRLAREGIAATCNPAGADKWKKEHGAFLEGADVILVPDNDKPGRDHMRDVARTLKGRAKRIRLLELPDLPEKEDASYWLDKCGTIDGFNLKAERAPDYDFKAAPAPAKAEKLADTSAEDAGEAKPLFAHWAVDPWPEPVDGAALLNSITELLGRHLYLPLYGAETIALWTVTSWCADHVDILPMLFLKSPVRGCGKTTTMDILKWLLRRSLAASNISPAALFRFIEAESPALLLDEMDASFAHENEELRGIINAGHTRTSANVIRCVGQGAALETRCFSTWCPKVLAAIKGLPGTIEDRSITVELTRKPRGEERERVRLGDAPWYVDLRSRLCRFTDDHAATIAGADPDMGEIENRLADNWRPLIAVAEIAGEGWPAKARTAARAALAESEADDLSIQLLDDIRRVFAENNATRFNSERLVEHLRDMPDAPWGELPRTGKRLSTQRMARLLKPYSIKPQRDREGSHYNLEMFSEAFESYLSPAQGE